MGVSLPQVKIPPQRLYYRHFMCLDELDEGSVRIFDIGKMTRRLTHVKAIAGMALHAVNAERKSGIITRLPEIIHTADVITYMYEARVTP